MALLILQRGWIGLHSIRIRLECIALIAMRFVTDSALADRLGGGTRLQGPTRLGCGDRRLFTCSGGHLRSMILLLHVDKVSSSFDGIALGSSTRVSRLENADVRERGTRRLVMLVDEVRRSGRLNLSVVHFSVLLVARRSGILR